MLDSYRVGNAGAIKLIGTPHDHDVLSGRGGAINAHSGNQRFREWVRVRKERYNLARTKAEKASVANEVMDLVKSLNPPGRFLQRDQSSVMGGTAWWVECDEVKAMAKTSQALREGAPTIRAAHKDELQDAKKRTRRNNKKNTNHTTAHPTTAVGSKRSHQTMQQSQPPVVVLSLPTTAASVSPPPVTLSVSPNTAIEQLRANVEAARHDNSNNTPPTTMSYIPALASPPAVPLPGSSPFIVPPIKRSRLSEMLYLPPSEQPPQPHIVKPDDTPEIAPLPSPLPLSAIPDLEFVERFPMPAIPKRECSIRRTNSLALSDIGSGDSWGEIEFVNPFEGDDSSLPPFSPFPERGGCGSGRSSFGETKSVTSELSDLADANCLAPASAMADSEFGEAMKDVIDAVHPGLASPGTDEPIPTHLYPYTPRTGVNGSSNPQLIC
ncbi:Transcriptional regulator [Seminavis robusta]|uniref:Transcriptional regulator n=1 Tax=Seminavis robusta TaxID=568900 RepID=A0A9N8HE52_9STRA|nr:Transcriptional regulator [Seminavis robusta]|eukprot:Sro287_g108640.1 Transcriptional regulator (438) ;mRNA; f:54275-55743